MTVQLTYRRGIRTALYAEYFEESPPLQVPRNPREQEERMTRFNTWFKTKYGGRIFLPESAPGNSSPRLGSEVVIEFEDDETAMMFKLRTADLI